MVIELIIWGHKLTVWKPVLRLWDTKNICNVSPSTWLQYFNDMSVHDLTSLSQFNFEQIQKNVETKNLLCDARE